MKLYFIRHGQSANNAIWAATGSDKGRLDDPPLTEKGVDQALCLAESIRQRTPLAVFGGNSTEDQAPSNPEAAIQSDMQNRKYLGLTHIYCSLMMRAVQTAGILGQALSQAPIAWTDLHETGGIYLADEDGIPRGQPGKPRSYFEKHYPELRLPQELDETGWWNRPFEPEEARCDRARRVLAELQHRHGSTHDRVAFISHGGFYNLLIHVLLGAPEDDRTWFNLNNTAITRIDFYDRRCNLVYTNRADHLPAELIT